MYSRSGSVLPPLSYYYFRFSIKYIAVLFSECWRKNSLQRAMHNLLLSKLSLTGNGIDLGAKDGKSEYYRFIDSSQARIVYTDIIPKKSNVIKMNFEEKFLIPENSYDFVLAFNVMEHIFNYDNFLSEIHRILKVGGKVYLQVPFLVAFHPDPNDYFRFTHQSLHKLAEKCGYRKINVKIYCIGPLTNAANISSFVFKFRVLKIIIWLLAISTDRIIRFFWNHQSNYYGGIHMECEK